MSTATKPSIQVNMTKTVTFYVLMSRSMFLQWARAPVAISILTGITFPKLRHIEVNSVVVLSLSCVLDYAPRQIDTSSSCIQ
jgi:hypothetical protein